MIQTKAQETVFQFTKSAVSGGVATILDVSILNFLFCIAKLSLVLSTTFGAAFGMTIGYILNSYWTFKIPIARNSFAKYLAVTIVAVALNDLMVTGLTYRAHIYYNLAKVIAIVVIFFFNFFFYKKWVFKLEA